MVNEEAKQRSKQPLVDWLRGLFTGASINQASRSKRGAVFFWKGTLAGLAAVSLTGELWAQERPVQDRASRITFATDAPVVNSHDTAVTFPSTSPAPLRWTSKGNATKFVQREVVQVQHLSDDEDSSEHFAPVAYTETDEVRPVAFTLQLNSPKNAPSNESGVQPAAGTAPVGKTRSVLSARQTQPRRSTGEPANSPLNDPFEDGAQPASQPVEDDAPALLGAPNTQRRAAPAEVPNEFAPSDDDTTFDQNAFNPPEPSEDHDPPPLPPPSVRPQPTLQEAEPLGEDPLKSEIPRGRATKNKRNCSGGKYNDRDCCADTDACIESLSQVKGDTIRTFDRDRLDITPRYDPSADTPEERKRADERKRDQLRQAGEKDWHNREGRVIAHGQLMDLRYGKVIIRDSSGKEQKLEGRNLSDDDYCFIAAWYGLPTECTFGNDQYEGRQFIASTFTWKASGLCHKPLYFEEVQLERYGHTLGPIAQPALSGVHFFSNIALLPYHMGINPPNECQYVLGYYRPGSCAPWMIPPVPLSVRGGLAEAGVIVGGAALLP